MGYTYDDFVSAATGAGMLEKFDKMDLETAKKNPEFGLSLLSLKKDAAAATTDEQRLLATEAANQLRKSYGSYTIGENGASEYAGSFGQQVADTMGKLQNYGDYSYGQEDAYQKLLEAVANPKEFSYDPETDPVYSAYKKAFLREGERATAQALAQASAATGGRPSSYAVTAAAQAGNNYAGQLADIIPSLFQGAYDRHNADLSAKLSGLSALGSDRQFDYGKWLDGYNRLQGMLGNLQTQDNTEYGRYLDAWNMAQQAEKEEFEKKLAAAELMATKKDYTLLGQLYGLTQEQIDVLNGVAKKTGPKTNPDPKLDGSGVDANTIINMQYSLGVEPTGVWDLATANAAGTTVAKDALNAWNKGQIGTSVNDKKIQASKAINGFAPKSYDRASLTKQIEEYGVYANPSTTRDYAKYAKENGYDGVIFKNIVDNGGYSYGRVGASTVAIAFDSNQIKSVGNTNPTTDNDIRYSLTEDTKLADEAKEQLVEALQGIAPQKSMDGHIRQLIDQYTTEQPVKPQAPKLKVDRGNLRRALNSSLGISEADAGKLAQALDAYTEAVSPKKPAKKQVELDVESKPTRAKRNLQDKLLNLFSIPTGQRAAMNSYIGSWADRIVKNGALTEADRKAFFAKMYESGAMTMPADEFGAVVREYMKGGRIYVADSVVADFGDDWESIRKRAFAAGIYLTRQRVTDGKQNAGIDSWNGELAEQLPWLFDSEGTDRRSMLEQIVKLAEEGKEEKISLAEYTAILAEQEFVSEAEVLDNLERQMDFALRTFAEAADIEIQLKERNLRQRLKEQADNKEARDKRKAANELRELQQRTLKTLQWLNRNRNRAPEELREAWDEVLGDIDLYAVGAANEMNWSEKHNATWKDLAQMYKDAKEYDKNFLPSEELKKIVDRLDATKIGDMDLGALQDLYKAAVGLRTEFHNRNNVINDEMQRIFAEVYTDSKAEIEAAPGGFKRGKMAEADKLFNLNQLTPMNVLQRMGGWDPNGAFYSMAKQLEKGERDIRRYTVQANAMLQEFLEENQEWVKRADGQGKDGIWYEVEIPELLALELGKKPEFGNTVKVYMTPAQKVHMYLESKNQDNLRHMTGGRTFADKELYSEGKRQEALSQGRTIRLAPETVKQIVSDLTEEEMELARLLEQYYNTFATKEINRVSNILYGYDKAMGSHYAPIYTNQNYTKTEFGVFDVTAEGVGNLKGRQYAVNPSYNISAFDAFERHIDQTARFCGMAIPARNWTTLMNWREKNNSTADVITHKWGEEGKRYIADLITTLQAGDSEKSNVAISNINKLQSNYISAIFGANPSIVLKQLGSIPLAGAYLGFENLPKPAQLGGIDRELIKKYTPDLAWRTMGYTSMETKMLKENPNWTKTNKFTKFTFGGGAITAMDGWAASTLWPWAENKVRKEHPELEIGTQEQIDKGESPFYKLVAKEFEDAVSRSQSVSDEMHQGTLRKSKHPFARMVTLFRSDSAQTYNAIRQKIGEAQYYARTGAAEEVQKAAKSAAGAAFCAMLGNALWGETVSFLMALWKNKGKKYRDDEDDEMTIGSVISEMGTNVLSSLAGVIIGGEELFEIIGNVFTGEKWYGIDTPGVEQLTDMIEEFMTAGGEMRNIIVGAVDVLKNGGDLGDYFKKHDNDLLGAAKGVAEAAAMYLGGIPVSNLEGYLMGLLKWISPELGAGYDDLFTDPGKSELEGLTGNALSSRMQRVMLDRGVEVDDQTAKELGILYEAGHSGAFPADVPGSITIKEKTHELSAMQQQTYDRVWSGVVSGALDELVGSEAYRNADKKTRAKMLGRLYSYANGRAKDALFDDYELTDTDAKTAKTVAAGIDLASYVAWASTTGEMKTHEKFAELAEWDLDEKAKKALVGAILGTDMKTENGNPTQYAKFLTAVEGGLSVDEYIDLRADGVEIDKYLKYQAAGLDPDAAADLSKTMDALEGEDEDLSDVQKWRAAVDSQTDVTDQLAALSVVMTESQHRKATVANDFQLRPKTWVQVQEMLPRYDADGNGSYKQAEVKTAVDAIGRSMGLSDKQKAAMWQLITGSTSAKNNPYSTSVGQQVVDKINKLKQSEDGNSLSFSEEIAKQFAARW